MPEKLVPYCAICGQTMQHGTLNVLDVTSQHGRFRARCIVLLITNESVKKILCQHESCTRKGIGSE